MCVVLNTQVRAKQGSKKSQGKKKMKTMKSNSRYNKYNQNQVENRSLFLPIMLCSKSSSIKDVKLSHRSLISNPSSSPSLVGCKGRQVKRSNRVVGYPPHQPHKLSSSAATSATANTTRKADPSPPEHNHDHCYSNSNPMTYQKLRRFFSSRSLVTSTPATAGGGEVGSETGGSRGRRAVVVDGGSRNRSKIDVGNENNCNKNSIGFGSCDSSSKLRVLNIEELDPPLPVIKRVGQQQLSEGNGDSNLWKRRFGGASLQSLQVQSVVHCSNNSLAVPVRTV